MSETTNPILDELGTMDIEAILAHDESRDDYPEDKIPDLVVDMDKVQECMATLEAALQQPTWEIKNELSNVHKAMREYGVGTLTDEQLGTYFKALMAEKNVALAPKEKEKKVRERKVKPLTSLANIKHELMHFFGEEYEVTLDRKAKVAQVAYPGLIISIPASPDIAALTAHYESMIASGHGAVCPPFAEFLACHAAQTGEAVESAQQDLGV